MRPFVWVCVSVWRWGRNGFFSALALLLTLYYRPQIETAFSLYPQNVVKWKTVELWIEGNISVVCWYWGFSASLLLFSEFLNRTDASRMPLQYDNLQKRFWWLWTCFRFSKTIPANDFLWKTQHFVAFEGTKPKRVSCFRTVPHITTAILLMRYI